MFGNPAFRLAQLGWLAQAQLISAADKNLYLSKRNGRNQTTPAFRTLALATSDVA